MVKCRTCLGRFSRTSSTNITSEFMLGKSIKQILLPFIPQMVTTAEETDMVCGKCVKQIQSFAYFVQNCIKVEKTVAPEKITNGNNTVAAVAKGNQNTTPTMPFQLVYLNVLPTPNHNGVQNGPQPEQLIQLQRMPLVVSPSTQNIKSGVNIALPNISPKIASTPNQILLIPNIQNKPIQLNGTGSATKKKDQIVDLTLDEVEKNTCETCNSVFTPDTPTDTVCCKCMEKTIDNTSDASMDFHNDADSNDGEMETETQSETLRIKSHSADPLTDIKDESMETMILTVPRTEDEVKQFLEDFSESGLEVYEYGPLCEGKNKRILFVSDLTVRCPECDIVLQDKKFFDLHMKYVHSNASLSDIVSDEEQVDASEDEDETFQCPFCQLTVNSAMALVQHLHEAHTVEEPFKCEKCGMKFDKKVKYMNHMQKYQNTKDCTIKKCHICFEEMSKDDFPDHVNNHKDIFCDQCGQTFLNSLSFKKHYAMHKAQMAKKKKMMNVKHTSQKAHKLCSVCGLLFTPGAFPTHIKTHTARPRNHMCHMCPKRFMTASYLMKHIESSHSGKRYECDICKIKVKTGAALANHQRLKHMDTFEYTCHICSRGFSRGDYYKRHLLRHENKPMIKSRKKYNFSVSLESKPVKCKYCFKVFKNVYLLRTHLLSHVKIKRYKCKFCNMTFANTGTRHRHQKRHADPNFDLSCKVCWRRMKNKDDLERHMAKHNQCKRYTCPICGEWLASKYLLNHHLCEQHTEQEEIEKETQLVLTNALEEFLL